MSRAIWKGSISFGLVNIPVTLFPAEDRAERLSFRMLDRRDMSPVKYERVNANTEEPVPWDDIVKGYELDDGEYVVVEPDDFKKANPKATQEVEILDVVDREDIDPRFFDTPYYLEPIKKGSKGYALLREALAKAEKVAIARVVVRTKQYVAALMPEGKALVLMLLRYAHELRDPGELDLPGTPKAEGVSARELEMAEKLVEGMAAEWDPSKYKDTYTDDLRKLIERKAKTGEVEEVEEPEAEEKMADVVDLMPLLKKSLEGRGRASSSGKAASGKGKPRGGMVAISRAKAATKASSGSRKKTTRRKAG